MADPVVTPEQAQQVLQQVVTPPTAASVVQPIRIETQTGQVFEGATPEEVIQKLTQSVENGTAHIRNLNERLTGLEQQSQQPAPGAQKTPQDQYWELWQKDPIQADRFAASVRLGVPIDAVDAVERQTIQNSYKGAQDNAVGQFLNNCPDFPNDQNSSYLMKTRHQELFPGMPHTAHTLEATFSDLVSNGLVEPLELAIEGVDGGPQPLPQTGSSQQASPVDFEAQFRSLPSDQMAKVIQELHSRGAR